MASFGKKIRGIRYHLGMSQEEIGTLLNTSKQNISRYEKEQNSPRIDTVDAFASKLGIPITFLINDDFSVQETINALENRSLIYKKYELSSSTIARTIQTMQRLNHEGQSIVAKTADGLDKSGQYRVDKVVSMEDYIDTYSVASAAAGAGAYNEGHEEFYRRVSACDIPERFDAQIDITGDSMEPTIPDGAVAFVEFTLGDPPKDGEIYVFQRGEDTMIKRGFFEQDKWILRSDNPDHADITVTESDSVRIIGRLVDWTMPV